MSHFAMILYTLCSVADGITIVLSWFFYTRFHHKAFKYLALLMTGALLSMIVEAVKSYDTITLADFETFKRLVYLILEPTGEILQFFLLPMVAFAAVGRKFPKKLNIASKIWATAMVATFPLEAITGSPAINMARELAGHFVFHISAYVVIFIYFRTVKNDLLMKALKNYLFMGMMIIPSAIIFQTGVTAGIFRINHPELPFPYIVYCLLFNGVTLTNAFRYMFLPRMHIEAGIPDSFIQSNHITSREKEILELALDGLNNRQIGEKLFISTKTVKNHIYSVYQKIGIQNRMQLVNKINDSPSH